MDDYQETRWATLFVACVALFLMPFMMSAVGVALPPMGREFGASAMQLGLVETTYVLSASIFLLAMGRLGDIYGRRRLFTSGIGIFTLMAGAISQAWSVESVIVLRFLQGMGGSMVMATCMAIIVSVFPPDERGKALGITTAAVYSGISCGPPIGGLLITAFGWRSVFYTCVPLGTLTFFITLYKLKGEWRPAKGEPFDIRGSLVYGCAIMTLIVGASNLDSGSWAWFWLGAGVIGLGAFVALESRTAYPVLDVRLLRNNRVFALSNLAALINYASTFGVVFFLSLYLQYVKGMTPREAGFVLMIQPVVQAVLSPLCGRLADRLPAPLVATGGMSLCACGLAVASTVSVQTPLHMVYLMLVLLGFGFALFASPNMSVIMGSVPKRHLGVASGLSASMRTLGMMTSMTIITIIFSMLMGGHGVTGETIPQFISSMRTAFLLFSMMSVAGILCSLGRLKPQAEYERE